MSKWPKKWVEAVWGPFESCKPSATRILDALHEVGALKDPPKPREWWICPSCNDTYARLPTVPGCCMEGDLIHVREVISDDD